MGTRGADHVTPLYPQKLTLTSPTGGGRSVGIVRSRTKATEFSLVLVHIYMCYMCECRPGWPSRYSDSLLAGGSGDHIRWGQNFPTRSDWPPIQWVLDHTRGVIWPRRGVDHTPPSSAEVKERVEIRIYSSSGPSWPILG